MDRASICRKFAHPRAHKQHHTAVAGEWGGCLAGQDQRPEFQAPATKPRFSSSTLSTSVQTIHSNLASNKAAGSMNNTINLDILGQQPSLNIYTHVYDNSRHKSIETILQGGLTMLASHYPWITGQIVYEKKPCGTPGVFRITP